MLPSIEYPINLIFSVVVCICSLYLYCNRVIPCQLIQNVWIMSPLSHGFFETFTSGRYYRGMKALKILACNSKHFRICGNFKKCKIGVPRMKFEILLFLITSVSNNFWSWKFTGVCFLTQESQKWHQNWPKPYWFWTIGKFYQNLPFSIYL